MLVDAGFQCLGDFECLDRTRRFPRLRTFLRNFLGDHGTVTALVSQAKARTTIASLLRLSPVMKLDYRYVEFITALQDGSYLLTANAAPTPQIFTEAPQFLRRWVASNPSVERVLAAHRHEISRIMVGEKNRTSADVRQAGVLVALGSDA